MTKDIHLNRHRPGINELKHFQQEHFEHLTIVYLSSIVVFETLRFVLSKHFSNEKEKKICDPKTFF